MKQYIPEGPGSLKKIPFFVFIKDKIVEFYLQLNPNFSYVWPNSPDTIERALRRRLLSSMPHFWDPCSTDTSDTEPCHWSVPWRYSRGCQGIATKIDQNAFYRNNLGPFIARPGSRSIGPGECGIQIPNFQISIPARIPKNPFLKKSFVACENENFWTFWFHRVVEIPIPRIGRDPDPVLFYLTTN